MRNQIRYAVNRCININRKADLSINMIIVAILALLVLVILAFVFSSKINLFGKGVSNCAGKCSQSFIGLNGNSPSGSDLCDIETKNARNGEVYTYNPSGSCFGDNKANKKACCIVAYTNNNI